MHIISSQRSRQIFDIKKSFHFIPVGIKNASVNDLDIIKKMNIENDYHQIRLHE